MKNETGLGDWSTRNKMQDNAELTLFQGLFVAITNGVAIYRAVDNGNDFVFVDMNPAGERLSQVKREDIIGKSVLKLFPGVREIGLFDVFQRVYRTGEPELLPLANYRDSRLTEWVENYVYRLPSGEVVAIYEDVTARKQAEAALAESEERFRLAMQATSDGLWDLNIPKMQVYYSPGWKKMLGYEDAEIEDTLDVFDQLLHPDEKAQIWRLSNAVIAGELEHLDMEFRLRHKAGHYVDILSRGVLIRDEGGQPARLIGTHVDISERKLAELRLRQAATVFESTGEGVMITNRKGTIVAVNRAFSEITGYGEAEALGMRPNLLRSNRHGPEFYQQMWQSINKRGAWKGEIWNRRKNGEVYPEWLNINAVRGDNGEISHYVGVFSDISDIRQSQDQLEHLAHHDPLTDLPNRLLLNARLSHALERVKRDRLGVGVMMIDLDRFKDINDSYGHPFGDGVLKGVAERIRKSIREEDTVARVGGDEFVVLLERIKNANEAIGVAENLMAAFAEVLHSEQRDIFVTFSAGLSLYPQDGRDAPTLLRNADAALYHAKEDGRNTYHFYTQEMTQNAFDRVFLETSMRHALERNEFHVNYQPKVFMRQGKLCGVEALLRWRHPDMGVISPDRFIPIAEESGFINQIGKWVLNQACHQGRQWLDSGFEFGRIAINVAGPQLQRGDLLETVQQALESSGLPGEYLVLEVTEGFVMREVDKAIKLLESLRALNIKIAIDDFGTGHSSLSYLKRLPLDELKIDRSFVRDLPNDAEDSAISRAVITLAGVMDLEVVAEGVETEEQRAFLLESGCSIGQGFLYSPAVPPEMLEKKWR